MPYSNLAQTHRLTLAQGDPNPHGDFILYWITAQRRLHDNPALQRAADWSRRLQKPILLFEPLRVAYPWASDRLHRFVLDGMADNARAALQRRVSYLPWIERQPGDGRGLLRALAQRACLTITDHFPAFFLPHMTLAAAQQLPHRFEVIDGNTLLPLSLHQRHFTTAHALRRFLQKTLPDHLADLPEPDPLQRAWNHALAPLPDDLRGPWAPLSPQDLEHPDALLRALPIDHRVAPVRDTPGGAQEAQRRLDRFLQHGLHRYLDLRNQPAEDVTSGLSPHLHFGHTSPFTIVRALLEQERWTPDRLGADTNGHREGWWGTSAPAEAFLDQVVTWRDLGFNTCQYLPDYDTYAALPPWARATLEAHADDTRDHTYSLEQFDLARTHDPLWNAAQRQLRAEGTIHNYLRMLWGKKILEWSPTPQDALDVMIELNNRYALDGRDPNSYSGIFWVLGRHDRAFGPERPVLGLVRYMSSDNTARKLRLKPWLARWGR